MTTSIYTKRLNIDADSSDSDLRQRSTMLAENGSDDLIVALGLLAAQRIGNPACSVRQLMDMRTPYAIAKLALGDLDESTSAAIRLFYDLWYRLKIPFACASLQWWYLLSLSLRDQDQAPEDALALASTWIEQLEAVDAAEQPCVFSDLIGLRSGLDPVFITADVSDVTALARAVASDAPLVQMPQRDGRPGRQTLSPARGSMHSVCHDRWPQLGHLSEHVRYAWLDLAPEDRTALLTELEQRVSSLEQVRLSTGSRTLNNAAFAAELKGCMAESPSSWSYLQLTLATLARCWREAGFVMQELNQSLILLPVLMIFMEKRIGDYDAVLGSRSPRQGAVLDVARLLGARRSEIEKSHLRCVSFDGSNWERREFLIRRDALGEHEALPGSLEETLERRFGVHFRGHGGSLASWDEYLEQVLEQGATPTDLICCVPDWAANATDLVVDYAIFTAPQGVKLDRPWELELTEVFCYTAFRHGLDPAQGGVPFDFVGIQNAIGQRMRYNVVKKSQNYALVRRFPAQSFNLPDIAIGEDANHGGHQAGGVRLSCRVPTAIGWRGRTWKGLADVRLNRIDYSAMKVFRPQEVPIAFRYVKWEKGIADATYRRNLLFDGCFCKKIGQLPGVDRVEPDENGGVERNGSATSLRD